jgi:hypothetical protein
MLRWVCYCFFTYLWIKLFSFLTFEAKKVPPAEPKINNPRKEEQRSVSQQQNKRETLPMKFILCQKTFFSCLIQYVPTDWWDSASSRRRDMLAKPLHLLFSKHLILDTICYNTVCHRKKSKPFRLRTVTNPTSIQCLDFQLLRT